MYRHSDSSSAATAPEDQRLLILARGFRPGELLINLGTLVRGIIVRICGILHCMNTGALVVLGGRIRERRKGLGWTQEELAERAEIDRSYIGGVERGERNLTFTMLCDIASSLECDVAALTVGLPEVAE